MRLHILETTTGWTPDVPLLEFKPEESPSGWVFLQQKPLIVNDIHREDRWPDIMQLLLRNNIVTSCWLPLTTAQHRLGALAFGFGSQIDVESQMDFMLQIAAQVAVAVDNTLNFEKVEKYQRQLARERDRLQVLLEITNTLVSELDIHDLFPSITACLRRAVPHEYSSLALRVAGTDQLRVHALIFEGDPGIQEGATAGIDETPAGQAVETRRPVVLDADALRKFPARGIQRLVDAGLRSVCCVPLITRTHVLGTLNVGSTRPGAFSPLDVDFLTQVAG
jgi:formate hydrogenlyase transcriptional activator